MAYIAATYSFANATTSDASQVNQNFTDIINGLSDGSKDISVNAVTAAGNLSVSGNTTLGNASGDDVTVTGSLASSIPIKTTNSYDIGAATLGLRAAYFGANSQTVKVIGSASMSATWTLTLPPATSGGNNFVLSADNASGVSTWTSKELTNYLSSAISASLSVAGTVVGFTAVATATLPTAVGVTGQKYTIINTAGGYDVTINTTSSQTIAGIASGVIKLNAKGSSLRVISDGTNWQIMTQNRFGATLQRFTSGSGTYTTPAGVVYIKVKMVGGGGGASGSGTAAGGAGGNGGNTTFGSSLLTASAGALGTWSGAGGGGATSTVSSPAITIDNVTGGVGGGYQFATIGTVQLIGGMGGGTPFGIATGHGSAAQAVSSGTANTGQGGAGALVAIANGYSGSGGGGGGYLEALINSPSATYAYGVGAGGTAGAAGTGGNVGGAGGSGVIIVEEYYV